MANKPIVDSPFTDSISKDPGKRGSAGTYDSSKDLPSGMPTRTTSPDGVPEKYYDAAVTAGAKSQPSLRGPIDTLFDGAIGKK